MKVFIKGSGITVDLTQKDYLAQGGEGSVYVKGHTAYKIYHDPSKMIPLGKFHELAAIKDPRVIRPQDMLVDAKGAVVGYTMRFIDGGYPLCQLFPRAFRDREGITQDMMLELVAKMQESINGIHQTGTLIVDLNEMNFMVPKKFDDVFFIDVDSYQTKGYPTQAIMESIRDWSVQGHQWTTLSDWYSFGILSFQMFMGIHPYRGKYHGSKAEFRGKLPTDPDDDAFAVTRRRMKGNISVMHPEVGVPTSAYPLTAIPREYLQWYEAMFVQGKRCIPPHTAGMTGVIMFVPTVKAIMGALIDISELWDLPFPVTGLYGSTIPGGNPVMTTTTQVYLGNGLVPVPFSHVSVCGHTNKANRAVVGGIQGTKLMLYNLSDRAVIPFDLDVKDAMSYDGRIYVRTNEQIHEVILTDAGAQVIASTKAVANVMPHATHMYSGVAIQSMLGATYVSMFVNSGSAHQVRVNELDGFRIVYAKFDKGVLMVLTEKAGKYDRQVFRFDSDDTYDVRVVPSSLMDLNFVTLDNGVCICLNEDDKLEMFSVRKGSPSVKTVEDKALSSDMILAKHAGSLVAYQGNKVLKLKMK